MKEADFAGKYEVLTSDIYCVVCHNQNTVLNLTTTPEYREEALDILGDLGYCQ